MKFEIQHQNKGRTQYNSYHNCNNVMEAVQKHKSKGFDVHNITNITHYIKWKYKESEIELLKGIFE